MDPWELRDSRWGDAGLIRSQDIGDKDPAKDSDPSVDKARCVH